MTLRGGRETELFLQEKGGKKERVRIPSTFWDDPCGGREGQECFLNSTRKEKRNAAALPVFWGRLSYSRRL